MRTPRDVVVDRVPPKKRPYQNNKLMDEPYT
jgi:hypothetical protein